MSDIEAIWHELDGRAGPEKPMRLWATRAIFVDVCEVFAKQHNIAGMEALRSAREFPMPWEKSPYATVTNEFVESVRTKLPAQPWKPGLRQTVCKELQCHGAEFSAAVDRLIEEGVFLRQKDGVIFDVEGNVAGFDPERVDPSTLELLSPTTREQT